MAKGIKTGGRSKGTPNKDKNLVRDIVEQCLGKSIPARLIEIAKKDPRQEASILEGLMPYAYARMQAIEVTADVESNSTSEEVHYLVEWIKKIDEDRPPPQETK